MTSGLKVGAQCGSSARWDLCGGRRATGVPTAIHPLGILSPYFRTLGLEQEGLRWKEPRVSVAHPFENGSAALLAKDVEVTGRTLGPDARAWRRLVLPFLRNPHRLLSDLLRPVGIPRTLASLRFAWKAGTSAQALVHSRFEGELARALFAGCAAHASHALERRFSAAVALLFAITAHVVNWPVAEGGSRAITQALAKRFLALGGRLHTAHPVTDLRELPPARAILFDLAPKQVLEIAKDALPEGYRRRLARYRYGPGVFKIDWALDGAIPWKDPRCLEASTVHVGGTFEEIAAALRAPWEGRIAQRPFLIVAQQSLWDPTRAPAGRHTGYAYAQVPRGSAYDMTDAIETQIERFAPTFRDRILARHTRTAEEIGREDPAYVGGAITGGAADGLQLLLRPVARFDPHRTPNPRLYLCGQATPPGGGVHGMCGYHAARSCHRRLRRRER